MSYQIAQGPPRGGAVERRVLRPGDVGRTDGYVTPEEEAAAWAMFEPAYSSEQRRFSPAEEEILLGGGGLTASGVSVGIGTALQVAAVFACCRVLGEDVAKMRRTLRRRLPDQTRPGGWRTRVEWNHPVNELISSHPNPWMTGFEFWEFMVFWAALTGTSAAWVVRVNGMPVELLPLRHGALQPVIDPAGWIVSYRIIGYGETREVSTRDVLIIRAPMADELNAFAPVRLAREAIGLSAAIEGAQARFHKNDLRPSGILGIDLGTTSSSAKSDEWVRTLKEDWQQRFGPGGDGGMAVLDKKFDFKTLNATSADSQTIENRKFQIEEVCRFFRVHPTKIMHPSSAATYGSVEQGNLSHVTDSLHPWVERCEQACQRDLVDRYDSNDDGLYFHFDMNAVARGTLGERVSAYRTMIDAGILTPNEAREREDLDPLPYPEMDRPQLKFNNTGLAPTPLDSGAVDVTASTIPPEREPLPVTPPAPPGYGRPTQALPAPRPKLAT